MTPEEYIKANTRTCNCAVICGGKQEWVPLEDVLAAVKLAKKEIMKEAIEGEIVGYPNGLGSTIKYRSFALKEIAHFPIIGEIGEKVKIIVIKE